MAKCNVYNDENGTLKIDVEFQQTDLNFLEIIPLVLEKFIPRNSGLFYHMFVTEEIVVLEKQGYNTPSFEKLQFNLSQLQIENMTDVLSEMYLSADSLIGDSYVQDAFYGSINSHLLFHDKRKNGGAFKEVEFYSKIRSLKKKKNSSL